MINLASCRIFFFTIGIIISAWGGRVLAQENTYEYAERLFHEGKYDSAATVYLGLFKQESPKNPSTYASLSRALHESKNFERLEAVAREYTEESADPTGYIDEYEALLRKGKDKKAEKLLEEVYLYTQNTSEFNCERLMHRLTRYKHFRQAKMIFKQFSAENKPTPLSLTQQYLELYFLEDSIKLALNHTLQYLEAKPNHTEAFIAFLDRQKSKEGFYTLFKQEIFAYTSLHGEAPFILNLLIWLEQVHGNFGEAARFGLVLARRSDTYIPNILDLAQDAFNSDALIECLELCDFILSSDYSSTHEHPARNLKLKAQKVLLSQGEKDGLDLAQLEHALLSLSQDKEASQAIKAEAILEYCKLRIQFQKEISPTINFLDSVIEKGGFHHSHLNQLKLLYGDALTMHGKPWKALIIYTQVDHDDGDGVLGEEARFKKAKLSYYEGEFEWAQAQLKILKGATSELVSNNAIQLSVFITDNLGLDSNTDAMSKYANIELLVAQHNYEEALNYLATWERTYSQHVLMDNALVMRAEIYVMQDKTEMAAQIYLRVLEEYPSSILCDNVHWELAQLYRKGGREDLAKDHYLAIITEFPDSRLASNARALYRKLP